MTREQIIARIAELEQAQAEANGWGAALGARHEELEGLRRALERSTPVTKRSLLEAAMAATADRGLNYGAPEDNFRRIADLWNVYLTGRASGLAAPITPADQALMMVLMKVARLQNTPGHLDNWVDLAGYAACGAEVACNAEPGQ